MASLQDRVNALTWYHNIDLGNGVVTPGRSWHQIWDPALAFMERAGLNGKEVLEIGSWDGMFSFGAEALGAASVQATDIKRWKTFELAREALDSRVSFKVASIYTLREQFDAERFDVVICYGVYYHLLHPMLGFVNLNHVLRPGGIALIEGAYYRRDEDRSVYYFSYGDDRLMPHDPTFCTCPTVKCLRNMLAASQLEPIEVDPYLQEAGDTGRVLVKARKRVRAEQDQLYEDTYPNQLLAPYD